MSLKFNIVFLLAFIFAFIAGAYADNDNACDVCIKACHIDPTDDSDCITKCNKTFKDCGSSNAADTLAIGSVIPAVLIAVNALL